MLWVRAPGGLTLGRAQTPLWCCEGGWHTVHTTVCKMGTSSTMMLCKGGTSSTYNAVQGGHIQHPQGRTKGAHPAPTTPCKGGTSSTVRHGSSSPCPCCNPRNRPPLGCLAARGYRVCRATWPLTAIICLTWSTAASRFPDTSWMVCLFFNVL